MNWSLNLRMPVLHLKVTYIGINTLVGTYTPNYIIWMVIIIYFSTSIIMYMIITDDSYVCMYAIIGRDVCSYG